MNRKVIVIGWDGGTKQVIEEGINKDYLPGLNYLIQSGTFLELISTIPPATIPAWTSCFTGVNPGKHGYFDFAHMVKGTYSLKFTNSTFRKFPAIWNWATKHNAKSIVLGVPGTFPPEKINGIMVSGFDSPLSGRMSPHRVYPQELYEIVKQWSYGEINESKKNNRWHDNTISKLIKRLERKEKIIFNLLENYDWDLFIAVFNESDTVSHHYWMFWDKSSPRFIDSKYQEAIPLIYEKLDRILRSIIKKAEKENALLMVVSDHGFQPADKIALHINNWLFQKGYLRFTTETNIFPKFRDFLLSAFPPAQISKLFYRLKHYAERLESKIRFYGIDWNRTVAYSEELDYFPSVRINLQHREPLGIVPEEDYYEFAHHLCKELKTIPYIKNVYFRESVYSGPYTEIAPDIILDLSGENLSRVSFTKANEGNQNVIEEISIENFYGTRGKGLNGQHHQKGILCLSEKIHPSEANIVDIAPTIASTLEIPTPPLDGKPLLGTITIDKDYKQFLREEEDLSPYEEWLLIQQMKELGYWQ